MRAYLREVGEIGETPAARRPAWGWKSTGSPGSPDGWHHMRVLRFRLFDDDERGIGAHT